jgi:hypothetical protein
VEADEGDRDEDDTGRLSKLIAQARLSKLITQAEVGLQAEEDEDDTGRLSELLALAEVGLQEEEDSFLSQAADEAEAAYYRRQGD